MLQLINTLYHGTAEKFERIDVFKGRNNKDFGKGFYMAVTKSQAIGMMHKKYREALLRRPNAPKDRFSETLYEMNEPRRKRTRYRSFAGFTHRTYPFIATQASGYVTRP